jgi:hypothetical protein
MNQLGEIYSEGVSVSEWDIQTVYYSGTLSVTEQSVSKLVINMYVTE